MLYQPTLAWLLGDILIIYGVVLVVLSVAFWPCEYFYKKKNGPIPKNVQMLIYVGLFVGAGVIALPCIVIYRSIPTRSPVPEFVKKLDQSNLVPQTRIVTKQQSDEERQAREKEREQQRAMQAKRDAELRQQREADAAIREAQRKAAEQQQKERLAEAARLREEADRRMAEARAAAEQRRLEAEQARAAAKARSDARRARVEAVRAMQKADFFKPPEGSTTDAQRNLDEKIIKANEALQELIRERDKQNEIFNKTNEELKQVVRQRPVDHKRVQILNPRLADASRKRVELSREIANKRTDLIKLVKDRYDLIND